MRGVLEDTKEIGSFEISFKWFLISAWNRSKSADLTSNLTTNVYLRIEMQSAVSVYVKYYQTRLEKERSDRWLVCKSSRIYVHRLIHFLNDLRHFVVRVETAECSQSSLWAKRVVREKISYFVRWFNNAKFDEKKKTAENDWKSRVATDSSTKTL